MSVPRGNKALSDAIRAKKSCLCVGLDTDPSYIPLDFLPKSTLSERILAFNRVIVQATQHLTIAYKLNTAFYEAEGSQGVFAMEQSIEMLRTEAPDALIIIDAKRGDVPHTAQKYAQAFFGRLNVDAITLSPYMGKDSVAPFLAYPNKWVILLALTSNKGAATFQNQRLENKKMLWEEVLATCRTWAPADQLMFVVAATQDSATLHKIRSIVPEHFLLMPGVGAQGAKIENVYQSIDSRILINSSRSLLCAANTARNLREKVAEQAKKLQNSMQQAIEKS